MARAFDRFMVADDIGTNRKLRRLPVAQRWVYVAGVLALAAQSPIRGALLIADGEPATEDDVAMQATVPVKDARAALAAFRRLGMLDADEDGVEWVHDWDKMNKDPKPSDEPSAARDRKRRQRAKSRAGHADVTRDNAGVSRESHAPEVEVEEEVEELHPPTPPQAGGTDLPPIPVKEPGNRARSLDAFNAQVNEYARRRFPNLPSPEREQMIRSALGANITTHQGIAEFVNRWAAA